MEVFWNVVFQLQSAGGDLRYKLLPVVIKSALVLAQTSAESESSLSVNVRIFTQERASISENTIVGLHVMKEAVRFFSRVCNWPEKIQVTQDLKKTVRSAHAAYKEWVEKEKEEEEKREEDRQRKEISERAQKERERLIEKKESLARNEEDLNEQETKARADLKAADEPLNDAT